MQEAASITAAGTKAADHHGKCFIHVSVRHNALELGDQIFKDVLDTSCLLEAEAAPGTSRINTPTLVLWDLNGIEFKGQETQMQTQIQLCVAAMKSMLVLQGNYGLGIIHPEI